MYKNHLEGAIKSRNLPKSLLLYGEEYFTSSFIREILPLLGESDNVLSFYFDEYNFASAKNFIAQPSLFGDVNILYIRSEKKIPKKELDVFVSLCHKNPTSYFLLQFDGNDLVGKDITKSFAKKNSADFVRFFKPKIGEAISLLQKKSRELSLEIDNYALGHLFQLQNENLALSMNELSKLLISGKKIYASDIDNLVYGMGEVNMDEFINRVLNLEDIRDELQKILDAGSFDEIRIISALQAYIVQLFMFNIYIKTHGQPNVLEILGFPLPPQLANQRAAQCIKINLATYQKVLKHLLDCERALKKMPNIDKNSYTFSALIKFQSYL